MTRLFFFSSELPMDFLRVSYSYKGKKTPSSDIEASTLARHLPGIEASSPAAPPAGVGATPADRPSALTR